MILKNKLGLDNEIELAKYEEYNVYKAEDLENN